jgi:hypothetical protein
MSRMGAALLAATLGVLAARAGAGEPPPAEVGSRSANLGGGEPAAPRAQGRIALDRLRAEGISDALVEAVQQRICAALAEIAGAEVICPSDVAGAMQFARQAALFGECATDACLERVDALRAADRRVTGALQRDGRGLVLSLQITGPGGPGPRFVERLPEDLDALVARIPGAVKKLFP